MMKVTIFICLHFSTLYHRLTHELNCSDDLNPDSNDDDDESSVSTGGGSVLSSESFSQ